jgi:hypothetical protein
MRYEHGWPDLVTDGARVVDLHLRFPRFDFCRLRAGEGMAVSGLRPARPMLLVAAALLVAWGLGLNLPNAAAGGIHLLLIAAIAVAIARITWGRKVVVIERRPHLDSVDELLGDTRVRFRQGRTQFASFQKLIDVDLEIRNALARSLSAELQLDVRRLLARRALDPH